MLNSDMIWPYVILDPFRGGGGILGDAILVAIALQ